MHNRAIATFLFGFALLALTPSVCLARRTRAAARRRLGNLQEKNARYHSGNKTHSKKNRQRTCARDAAIEVLLRAEITILDIPFYVENPRELEKYVNDVRDCAVSFLQNLECATIQEDISKGRVIPSSQMNDMKGRIMEESTNGAYGGAVVTPEQCCSDADAIRDLAAAHIKSIESNWSPDADGTPYDAVSLKRKVESGLLDGMKERFAGELKTFGGIYLREIGNELDPVCRSYPRHGKQKIDTAADAARVTLGANQR